MVEKVGFREMSVPKKIAAVGVAAAGVASLVIAAKTGKVADTFEGSTAKKALAKVANGYKGMGSTIKKVAVSAFEAASAKFAELTGKVGKKAPEIIEEVSSEIV